MSTIRVAVADDDKPANDQFRDWLLAYISSLKVEQYFDRASIEAALRKERFDLILMDLEFKPDPNAGLGLIYKAGKTQSCPVVVITGQPPEKYEDIVRELEAVDFLVKPVKQPEFTNAVRAALRKRSPHEERNGALPPGLVVDPLNHVGGSWHGKRLHLTLTEQRILERIAKCSPNVVTNLQLAEMLSYSNKPAGAIRQHVFKIKKAFKAVDPDFHKIRTAALSGYAWVN